MASYFKVIKEIKTNSVNFVIESFHFQVERKNRREKIKRLVGVGNVITSFIIDKNHDKGFTRDYILDNGVVIVVNERTRKIVTEFIARPAQIARYWNHNVPQEYQYIINISKKWQKLGYID